MRVLSNLSRTWRSFRAAKPGERFRNAQRNRKRSRKSKWSSVVSIAAGVLLIAAGLLALVMPGPGGLLLVLGAALIARESAAVAKVMDAVELRLRAWARWGQRFWKRSHWSVKALLILLSAALTAAAAWGAWTFYQSR